MHTPDLLLHKSLSSSGRHRRAARPKGHWPAITAAGIAAAALLAGSVAALLQSRKSDVERARSAQVSAFLQDMLSAPDARLATPPSRPRASSHLSDILDAAADRAGVVLTADPAVETVVRKTLGRTYPAIGKYDRGVALLQLAERKPAAALTTITAALDSASLEFSPGDPRFAEVQDADGQILLNQHRRSQAIRTLDASYATFAHTFGEQNPETQSARSHLEAARDASGS